MAASPWAGSIAFAWGFAEATLFFIIPDVWLTLIALFQSRSGWRTIPLCLAGALLGGAVMHAAGRWAPEPTTRIVASIPGVNPAMIQRVRQEVHDDPAAMLRAAWQGVPYKLYALEAGRQGRSLPLFLLLSIPARLLRLIPLTLLAAGLGVWFRPAIERWPSAWGLAVLALWGAGLFWFFFIGR